MKASSRPALAPAPALETGSGLAVGLPHYDRSITIALLRAREEVMRRFKCHADARDLTLPQWRVLRALAEGCTLDAGTLCERCVILPPSLTRILRALAARGLIEPVPDADARRHVVRLTAAGDAICRELSAEVAHKYAELEQAFGAARLVQLLDLLDALHATARALSDADGLGPTGGC
jgi:homoprotocatechuate degradation regulator HpaR